MRKRKDERTRNGFKQQRTSSCKAPGALSATFGHLGGDALIPAFPRAAWLGGTSKHW